MSKARVVAVRALARCRPLVPVLAALCAGCWSPPDRVATLRPLTLRVIDAGSKAPLEGVLVTYVVESSVGRDRFLGVIASLEPVKDHRVAVVQQATTDRQGEVTFAVRGLPQPGNERWSKELAFVNLAVKREQVSPARLATLRGPGRPGLAAPAAEPSEGEIGWWILTDAEARRRAFWNPAAGLGGVVLIGTLDGPAADRTDWSRQDDRFRVRWHDGSPARESERVEVELESVRAP